MGLIEIIKHKKPEGLKNCGDILYPFESWRNTNTGAGWYSKVPDEFLKNSLYLPLTSVSPNSWEALEKLSVHYSPFKDLVKYTCPYNGYEHYWCVPVLIFTKDLKTWTSRCKIRYEELYFDQEWVRNFYPCQTKKGLPFTRIQRSLLGSGYTETTMVQDGKSFLYDAIVALNNGDFLGVKVWMWFNK